MIVDLGSSRSRRPVSRVRLLIAHEKARTSRKIRLPIVNLLVTLVTLVTTTHALLSKRSQSRQTTATACSGRYDGGNCHPEPDEVRYCVEGGTTTSLPVRRRRCWELIFRKHRMRGFGPARRWNQKAVGLRGYQQACLLQVSCRPFQLRFNPTKAGLLASREGGGGGRVSSACPCCLLARLLELLALEPPGGK
ncbi:hypothetical protein BJ875DRAFT_7840 [Amylocarpus encephaloides]|uniref:Uncharacterized protein n=1 Tax=Amylocarpus encephaloides TaxID=45428 RepID=A0A9P7YK93_9HELO|nr:hypothetical protein BJ875DRAFT_7840 [Amylocarpus encephaloides]